MNRLRKLDVIGLLQEHGALLSGHFKLPSGLHSQTYVQTALVLQYPNLGAVVIGQEVARAKKCRAIFTEKVEGVMTLKREFRMNQGDRMLVVEDVLTTGRSTSEVVSLSNAYGGKVVGVVAIVDRSTAQLPLTVPVRALISYPLQLFPPESCPLCSQEIPVTVPGIPGGKAE